MIKKYFRLLIIVLFLLSTVIILYSLFGRREKVAEKGNTTSGAVQEESMASEVSRDTPTLTVAISTEEPIYIPKETLEKSNYFLHGNITATVFWVGEEASSDNNYISNDKSAWDSNWVESFGGVDEPSSRSGWHPSGFTPRENPFYLALPYSDYDESGRKSNLNRIAWFTGTTIQGVSLVKNRWVKVMSRGEVCYGQWENTGPSLSNDTDYVFGTARPANSFGQSAGIDISPALRDCLGIGPVSNIDWQFVDESDVPSGPWKEIVTTSNPNWSH